ncbi:MAG TPA: HAD-IC family P-type ATPase, partial [Methanocorpusculum sp.]|nr:HAD-IC family P-type ATPase [Methanocorpusculum sp.]
MTEQNKRDTGLTSEEVHDRIKNGLVNTTDIKVSKSILQIFLTNIFTYFNLIFVVLALFVCTAFDGKDFTFVTQLSFLLIVIVNTFIGIFQELRAKRVLDKMTLFSAPKTTVLRDGTETVIPSADLVKDDVIILNAGDTIPADARMLSGNASVNESLLTGEEREVRKNSGDELFSGSYIVSGTCRAVLEKVGKESYISKLSIEAKKMKRTEQSEMTRSVNTLLKVIGIIIIPVGISLFLNAYLRNAESYAQSVFSTAGAITAMIPEGLYLLMTVVLAVGTIRLAKRKVLLHEMKSIESLARVDTLCVDKTGTITRPDMQFAQLLSFDEKAEGNLARYVRDSTDTNGTMKALKEHFSSLPASSDAVLPTEIIPFSSSVKYGIIRYPDVSLYLGAPEFVLDSDNLKQFNEATHQFAAKGERVLVLAAEYPAQKQKSPLAAVMLQNALRDNAVETFRYFHEEGVTIKVISGDNPLTVSEVAKRAGIPDAELFVDATTLTSDELINEA